MGTQSEIRTALKYIKWMQDDPEWQNSKNYFKNNLDAIKYNLEELVAKYKVMKVASPNNNTYEPYSESVIGTFDTAEEAAVLVNNEREIAGGFYTQGFEPHFHYVRRVV